MFRFVQGSHMGANMKVNRDGPREVSGGTGYARKAMEGALISCETDPA